MGRKNLRRVGQERQKMLEAISVHRISQSVASATQAILVGFLALYGLGPLSSIYTAASNSKVHVPDDCKTAVTRLITSEASYQSFLKALKLRRQP